MIASRRSLLAFLSTASVLPFASACNAAPAKAKAFPIVKSDAEWKRLLTPSQYAVLRKHATERPGSSPLDKEKRKGTFVCAADRNPLFSSATKFDSGTGWPSFWKPLPGAIGTATDYKLIYPRTEVHCAECGGHLGHVFKDGPKPTGLRYCMNGDAMLFVPA
ncbi:MAG: peptide-methionine (R)-S-oxide reductase MsrB [Novosphingobium sp.]|nr:peptide-methionine (R)-S-oxide reductase MsrB [Novosphingobium sp.]